MKKITLSLFLLFSFGLMAQNFKAYRINKKTLIVESKSLVGMWNQVFTNKDANGETKVYTTGNYKVINADKSFYTFITWGNRPTTFGLYGVYKITSDSTYTERITKHGINPMMTGSTSQLRFKFVNQNTVYIMYNNNGMWIPEMWIRVLLSNTHLPENAV